MDLSIVIPAYEEGRKIAMDIDAAARFLRESGLTGQIIVVDDGSKDNTTETARNVTVSEDIELKVIRYIQHKGKGHAVRRGIEQSAGQFVMFADSGKCVPYKDALKGLELIKSGACDIAHGSRKTTESRINKPQNLYRRICSRLFHWFVVHRLRVPRELTDTQCGFKIYRGDAARHLYGQCVTDGFVFDIEIILRAVKEGYRIREFPIDWTCDPDTRLSPSRSLRKILAELRTIRRIISKE
jgi:dolichyl-phosphate beta-glucosyltransferase